MTNTDLLFVPAVKAAALRAIERVNPRLNCFREVMADTARRDTRAAAMFDLEDRTIVPLIKKLGIKPE